MVTKKPIMMLVLVAFSAAAFAAQATVALPFDDFEDGTTQGWQAALFSPPANHPNPPANIATGGPGGAGDNYLELNSTGLAGTAGSNMTVFNLAQWTGNYLAQGITGIRMDARNLGNTDLNLWLSIADFTPAAACCDNGGVSGGIPLSANGDWQTIFFSLAPADLFIFAGDYNGAMSNVEGLRLYHSPDGSFIPTANTNLAIEATLGLDNISAVPLPAGAWLLISGIVALLGLRRRVAYHA